MSRKGENIRKRKDGRWEGRFRTKKDSGPVYHSVYARSYREVKEKLAQARSDDLADSKSTAETFRAVRLDDLAAEWLEQKRQLRKHSTYQKYRNTYEKYLKEALGQECVGNISSELVRRKLSTGFSDSLYKSIYCVLNQILNYGAVYYNVPDIRLRGISRAREGQNTRMDVLNDAEQTKLIRFLCEDTDSSKFGILLCLFTGLRLGEICALKWEDIDMNSKIIRVNSTVQRLAADAGTGRTSLMESTPKSGYSRREIPLSDSLFEMARGFCTGQKYVLGGNKPMEPRTYQNRFKLYLKLAGIEAKKFHILRHTFATNCINSGADVKSISEILGHADVKITLNRYVHPSLDVKRKNMDSMISIYGQNLGQLLQKA